MAQNERVITPTLEKILNISREEGVQSVISRGVDHLWGMVLPSFYDAKIRPHLPATAGYVQYNDVNIDTRRTFDSVIPWQSVGKDRPEYEGPLVERMKAAISSGDTVTIVGGGWGVSTTVAARAVGDTGTVRIFEGSEGQVRNVEKTIRLNHVTDSVEVMHAIVGEDAVLRGTGAGASTISPADLPECDVLVLDCDSAEFAILEGLSIRPETIVVEHHAEQTAQTFHPYEKERLYETIDSLGYQVVAESVGENYLSELVVLAAEKR